MKLFYLPLLRFLKWLQEFSSKILHTYHAAILTVQFILSCFTQYKFLISITVLKCNAFYCQSCELCHYSVLCSDYCIPISDVASRRHLHSARRHYLVVPRHSLSSYGRQAFAVAGPTAWNSLSDDLRDPTLSTHSFRCRSWLFLEY